MKVFLDTNVLVSAAATRGLCADVLREVLISHKLVVSPPLFSELENILKKKLNLPYELISEFIEILQQDAHQSSQSDLPDVEIQDKDDLTILSSALNGETDVFITGDKELLELSRINDMDIISPKMFWERLKVQFTKDR
ncbi:MAG: putative toxin-antitoxin system toxin component, PIN family [Candidatus Aminicenantes bacterium]|jgi:putative PIN family toxin of toxin-antitoxin system|nr:putative toxin-antitoxin system toxin component, PIN family [Candidatus Aminicenantes bacterium]TET88817.1 MAG: putative toxin-antitoxin system toxin component, PIN family [Desulfobacteraceae bacterium]